VHAQQQEQQQQQQQVQPPSAGQVADLLYDRWLLDVPKMMDLAVLFGPGSSRLTQQLLQQLLHLQPKYAQVGEGGSQVQVGATP
jgi:activating signal cointegrator complex subunit 2